MKSNKRLLKLKKLSGDVPSGSIMTVSEYAKEQNVSVQAIYNKIDLVINKKSDWKDYIAYRKGNNIAIVKQ